VLFPLEPEPVELVEFEPPPEVELPLLPPEEEELEDWPEPAAWAVPGALTSKGPEEAKI